MLSRFRRILKTFHPEGIPWPGACIYNAVSKTAMFQAAYDLVAEDLIACCAGGRVLDIGTGPGFLLVKLSRLRPELRITGLDISPAMVSVAKRNIEATGLSAVIDIWEGSAGHLPFADETFDTAVSTASFHHWKDPVADLNEIYRVLKRGGRALIYDLATDMPKTALEEVEQKFGKFRTMIFRLHTFEEPFRSSEDLEQLARASLFGQGRIRFLSVFCCLNVQK